MVWREFDRQVPLGAWPGHASNPVTASPLPLPPGTPWAGRGGARSARQQLLTPHPPRAKLYTADLESGLHYLLRVELATHRSLAGAELKTLRDFVTVLAKVQWPQLRVLSRLCAQQHAHCVMMWS